MLLTPALDLFPGDLFPGAVPGRAVFRPPTVDVPFRFPDGRSLFGAYPQGQTVWRDTGGAWHITFGPGPDLLAGADRIYGGGRIHDLTDDLRAELEAAGFGAYITTEEF